MRKSGSVNLYPFHDSGKHLEYVWDTELNAYVDLSNNAQFTNFKDYIKQFWAREAIARHNRIHGQPHLLPQCRDLFYLHQLQACDLIDMDYRTFFYAFMSYRAWDLQRMIDISTTCIFPALNVVTWDVLPSSFTSESYYDSVKEKWVNLSPGIKHD